MHEYLFNYWLEHGSGAVRLTTSSERYPVHHLCERFGFSKIGERLFLAAPALQADPTEKLPFQPISLAELPGALDFLLHSPTLEFSRGLIDLGWRHAAPRLEYLGNRLEAGRLWWWRGGEGLLACWEEDEDDEDVKPALTFLACRIEDAAALLLDYRRLAGSLGYTKASWMAPLHEVLQPALEQAGFTREWDETLFLYAR